MDAEVSAKRAQLLKLFMHLVIGVGNVVLPDIKSIYAVNTAGHGAVVVTIWTQPHSQTLGDPATVPVVAFRVFRVITRCVVERRKIDLWSWRFGRVFDQHIVRNPCQTGLDLVTVSIRHDRQPEFGTVFFSVSP